jgi:hypothetical protein
VNENPRPHVVRVRVSAAEKEFLERVAQEDGRDVSNVLRLALKEFYERRIEQQP